MAFSIIFCLKQGKVWYWTSDHSSSQKWDEVWSGKDGKECSL